MKKIIQLINLFTANDSTTLVYALSYSLLLSFAPLFALLVLFFRKSPQGLATIMTFAQHYIPTDLLTPFIDFFLGNSPKEMIPLVIFIVISLWVASRAIYSFLRISAHLDMVTLPFWFMRIVSVIDFVVLLITIVLVTVLLQLFHLGGALIQLVALFLGFLMFYRLLSFRNYHLKSVAPGALFTSVGIYLLGTFFFYVINNFTRYHSIYGPLSSMVILFLSVYIISSIIYLGFCINQVFVKKDMVQPLKHYVDILDLLERIFPFSMMSHHNTEVNHEN